jgi:osmoprotectant transport system substrate-binding protein
MFKEVEMTFFKRSLGAKFLLLFALIPMLILSACGSSTGGTTSSGTSTPTSVPITVGSKLDPEAQLLGQMYVLLLQKAGYTVNPKLALGQTPIVFAALKSGAIDLYPEFTATGLNILNVPSSFNPTTDYQTVKNGFQQQYHITWLDQAPLNDGYALCTSQATSQKLGVTTLSQLASKVPQLTLTTQSDGVAFFNDLKSTYGFDTTNFKSVKKVDYALGFTAVKSGAADVTECYTTDGSVTTQGFIFLQDDKHGFPEFHPAPIVRDSVLQSDPGIAAALNKLAPYLTTKVSIDLQNQVAAKHTSGESISQAVKEVATSFLTSNGLL